MKYLIPLMALAIGCGKSKDDNSTKPGTADAAARSSFGIWRTDLTKVADNNGGGSVIVEFEIGDGYVAKSKICDQENGKRPYLVTQKVPAVIQKDGFQMLRSIDTDSPQWAFGESGIVSCGIYDEMKDSYKFTISEEKGLEVLANDSFLQRFPLRAEKRLVDEFKDVELIQKD